MRRRDIAPVSFDSSMGEATPAASAAGSSRYAALSRARKFSSAPSADPVMLRAISSGRPINRPLTEAERIAVAVAASEPTHLLTIDSAIHDRQTFDRAWRLLAKRLARRRPYRQPLVYFGSVAQGLGDGGFHVHLLLWEFLPAWMLHQQTHAVGLGHPKIQQIGASVLRRRPLEELKNDEHYSLLLERLYVTRYVVNQHEAVLGGSHHQRHQPRAAGKRRYLYPQAATLDRARPNLLAALKAARSPTVSDEELIRYLP